MSDDEEYEEIGERELEEGEYEKYEEGVEYENELPDDVEPLDEDERAYRIDENEEGNDQGVPYIEDNIFKTSFKEMERVGMPNQGGLSTIIEGAGNISKIQDMINRISRTSEELFVRDLHIFAKTLNISTNEILNIVKILPLIDKIKYKNSFAFLLGYRSINKINNTIEAELIAENLKLVKKKEAELKEIKFIKPTQFKIRDVDIYRYAKHIVNIFERKVKKEGKEERKKEGEKVKIKRKK